MIMGTLRRLDETTGAVRIEDSFATDADDLWAACTEPDRLSRWIAAVSGDLRPGGAFTARFTSGWEGTGTVETCDPPRRLVVRTRELGADHDGTLEARLVPDGDRTRLIVEERGLPLDDLADYGAGWQVHVEDLRAHLDGRPACDPAARWRELIGGYRARSV